MKLSAVIFTFLTTYSSLFAQDRILCGDTVSFFYVIEKTDKSGITFSIDALDSLEIRTDSIFKTSPFKHDYWFTSYRSNGEIVGIGSFHFHVAKDQKNYTEKETDNFLLNSFTWPDIHVSSFANCNEYPKCDMFELYFCHENPTATWVEIPHGILSGSQTGRTFSAEEIRRMPGGQ